REFRTPLTVLLGHAETLFEDLPLTGGDHRARLSMLRRNAFRLLKSVETMLELARATGGPRLLRFEPVDLGALLTSITAAFRPIFEHAGVRLHVDIGPLPGPVHVDRPLWSMAAPPLIANALKPPFPS